MKHAADRAEVPMWQSGHLRCVLYSLDDHHVAVEVLREEQPICIQTCSSPDTAAAVAESLWELLVKRERTSRAGPRTVGNRLYEEGLAQGENDPELRSLTREAQPSPRG